MQFLFFPNVVLNERAEALLEGVDTWHAAVWFQFKMWMIRLAATLGKAYGREPLLFLIGGVARLACSSSDSAVASWFIALTIILSTLKSFKFVHNQLEGDTPPGFWLACILVLMDACFVISAWWYVLQAEPASTSHDDVKSHQAAIGYAWFFVAAATYNAAWLCLKAIIASLLKLCRIAIAPG
jgi:hypothetical protein